MDFDRAGLKVLDRSECLRLLGTVDLGRVAINVGALPAILPVRFVLHDERIVLCAGVGTVLERATDGNVVAFEADGTEPVPQSEWSVSLIGLARHLDDSTPLARAASTSLPRWSTELSSRFVSISSEHISGRRALR
jgi:uncharacterized protein